MSEYLTQQESNTDMFYDIWGPLQCHYSLIKSIVNSSFFIMLLIEVEQYKSKLVP